MKRYGLWVCFLVVVLIVAYSLRSTDYIGDGREYSSAATAFINHGTPAITADDIEQAYNESGERDAAPWQMCIVEGRGGVRYPFHFWLYPAMLAPFKWLAQFFDANAAPVLLNLVLVFAVIAFALRAPAENKTRRYAFLALAVAGPPITYLAAIGAEIFTWSCIVAALVLMENRRYWAAVLFAAIGSTQNPPAALVILPILALCYRHDRRQLIPAILASCVAAVPSLWQLWAFGTPNLLSSYGQVSIAAATPQRVFSLLFDLNQGVAMFTPVLVLLFGWALFRSIKARDYTALSFGVVTLGICAACVTNINLNNASLGVVRYGVWTIPLMAWVVARSIEINRRSLSTICTSAVLATALMFTAQPYYLHFTAPAQFVMEHAPALYQPIPEIHAERTAHVDGIAEN